MTLQSYLAFANLTATILLMFLASGCQEKVINIGGGNPVEGVQTTQSPSGDSTQPMELEQLRSQLQSLKTELETTSLEYANYRDLVRKEISKSAVGMQLGDIQFEGAQLRDAVVEKIEKNFLLVKHSNGATSVPINTLEGRLRVLFDPDKYIANSKLDNLKSPVITSKTLSTAEITETFKSDCLVLIGTSDGASGSGFLVKTSDGVYVYTNAHVICGESTSSTNRITSVHTASGKELKVPAEIEISNVFNRPVYGLQDLARFKVPDEKGLVAYSLIDFNEQPKLKDKLVVYGDSDGRQVITELKGEVLGVGGDMVEISNIIQHGNSGGPVVSAATGKVIGVSTYGFPTPDTWKNTERHTSIRYFALRPEKVQSWFTISTINFSAMLDRFAAFEAGTRTLVAVTHSDVLPDGRGFLLPSTMKGDYDLGLLITNPHPSDFSKRIAAQVIRLNERLGGYGGNLSMSARKPIFLSFFEDLKNTSRSDTASFEKLVCPPYLGEKIPNMVKERKGVENQLAMVIVEIEAAFKSR